MKKFKINTTANKITVARMFLGGLPPSIVIYYFHGLFWWMVFCFFWVLLWEVSDIIDGRLARLSGQVSEVGKLLDPLADIKMHIPIFIVLTWLGICPMWTVLIIVMRELSITGGRAVIAILCDGEATPSRLIGKIKTWGYALSILYALAFTAFESSDSPFSFQLPKVIMDVLFYSSAAVSLYTWGEYGWHFWKKIRPFL